MISVTASGNRWTWTLIGHDGRALVHAPETYASDFAANSAAREYRRLFWQFAAMLDWRQGAAI